METREKEIDIKLLIIHVLKQWRWMMILGIICAIALTGYQYLKDWRQIAKTQLESVDQEDDVTLEDLRENLTADEYSNVTTYTTLYENLAAMRNERETSILYQIDPYHENVYTLTYLVQLPDIQEITDTEVEGLTGEALIAEHLSDETLVNQLADAYMSHIFSADIVKKLLNEMPSITESDIHSIITSWNSYGVVYVQIAYLEDMDIEKIGDIVKEDLKQFSSQLQKVEEHEFIMLDETYGIIADEDLKDAQYIFTSRSYNIQSQMNALENNFDEAEKEYIRVYLDEQAKESGEAIQKDDDSTIEPIDGTEEIVSPRLSMKKALIGFLIGILLVWIWKIITYIVSGRLHSAETLSDYYQLPVYGIQESEKSAPKKGIDRLIYKLEHNSRKILTPDAQTEIILSGIRLYCQQHELKEIAFSGTDIECLEESYLQMLKTDLQESGIDVKLVQNIFYYPEALQEAAEVSKVILLETVGVSIETEIENILVRAKEYNIQVVGAVVFQR